MNNPRSRIRSGIEYSVMFACILTFYPGGKCYTRCWNILGRGIRTIQIEVTASCEFGSSTLRYSEAELTLTYPRDWTENGVSTLTIWFRGSSDNAAELLYVVLNGNAVVYHDNPNAAQIDEWTEWNIDLQAFADQGVNLVNVNTIALGFGNRNNPQAGARLWMNKLETLVFDIENKSSVSNRPALTRVDSKRFRCVELFPRKLVFRVAPCSKAEKLNLTFEVGCPCRGRRFIAGARYEHTTYQIFMSGSAWPTIDKS